MKRAQCYMDLGEYEDAVRDYERALKMEKSRDTKRLLQEAKMALKRSKRKDYYKILGVDRSAGEDEIKRAYKKRALIHHPDRHANATEAERREQEKMFKELGEAYGVLSDPKKKMRYDNGQDLDMDGMDHGMHGTLMHNYQCNWVLIVDFIFRYRSQSSVSTVLPWWWCRILFRQRLPRRFHLPIRISVAVTSLASIY